MESDHPNGLQQLNFRDNTSFHGGTSILGNRFDGSTINFFPQHQNSTLRPWTVPRQSTDQFVGRSDLLQSLAEALSVDRLRPIEQHQRRAVLTGVGGIGKSEVCLRHAERMRDKYWGIFWIDVDSAANAISGFAEIGKVCGFAHQGISEVKSYLSSRPERWLLILDNADDAALDLSQFFPSGHNGDIMITSRNPTLRQYSNCFFRQLDDLSSSEALQLILASAGTLPDIADQHKTDAREICQRLDNHPLGVKLAGSFIGQESVTFSEYLEHFDELDNSAIYHEPEQNKSHYGSLYKTFDVAAQQLQARRENGQRDAADALDLMNILAFFHREGDFAALFNACLESKMALRHESPQSRRFLQLTSRYPPLLPRFLQSQDTPVRTMMRWQRACRLIRQFAIISTADELCTSHMSIHPLLHKWLLARQTREVRRKSWFQAVLILALCISNMYQVADRNHWMMISILGPHLVAFLRQLRDEPYKDLTNDLAAPVLYQVMNLTAYSAYRDPRSYLDPVTFAIIDFATILKSIPRAPKSGTIERREIGQRDVQSWEDFRLEKEHFALYDCLQAMYLVNIGCQQAGVVLIQQVLKDYKPYIISDCDETWLGIRRRACEYAPPDSGYPQQLIRDLHELIHLHLRGGTHQKSALLALYIRLSATYRNRGELNAALEVLSQAAESVDTPPLSLLTGMTFAMEKALVLFSMDRIIECTYILQDVIKHLQDIETPWTETHLSFMSEIITMYRHIDGGHAKHLCQLMLNGLRERSPAGLRHDHHRQFALKTLQELE